MQTRQIDLVLNKLLKAQYEGTTPNTDELYLVTDDAGITSADVVNALGYTPYNATNPNGYTSNVGTVTSVNGVQPVNGNVTIDLSGKADADLTNITDSAKVMMSGMGMPSDTYTDLTLGASNSTYTAPADGYFVILMNAVNNTTMTVGMASGVSRVGFTTIVHANNNLQGYNFGGFIPVKKGDTASVFYSGTTSAFRFRFVYAVGSESEAN